MCIYLSIYLSVYVSIYLSVHLSIFFIYIYSLSKGTVNCINVAATWVSRYAYSADYNSIYEGFSTLRQKGINRVYFNIWADGNLYANSATAQANGKAATVYYNGIIRKD